MTWIDKTVIYDRLYWYEKKEVREQARDRFGVLMKWLEDHKMLSDEGKDAAKQSISDDFVLYDRLLTNSGKKLLDAHYKDWLFSEGTSDPITTKSLGAAIQANN